MASLRHHLLWTALLTLMLNFVTAACTSEFSLRHTVFLFVVSVFFTWGTVFYQNKKAYIFALSLLMLVFCSVFLIRYFTPNNLRIWNVNTYISFCFALSSFILLMIGWCRNRRQKFLLCFLVLMVVCCPVMLLWGYFFSEHAWMDANAGLAIVQTNPSEALSYIRDRMPLAGYVGIACFFAVILFFSWQSQWVQWKNIHKSLGISLLFFVLLNGLLIGRTQDNFVMSIYDETKVYVEKYEEFKRNQQNRKIHAIHALPLDNPGDSGVYVLVIGESQNRDHMAAYGYFRDTTPWLSSMKHDENMLLFAKAYSCHVLTVSALSYALTAKNQYNDIPLETAVSLIELANAAGYETVWISNQVRYGAWDTPISAIAGEAGQQDWLNSHVGETLDTDFYDGAVLDSLDKIKLSDRMLIVVHLMGSHISYPDRYPKEFGHFTAMDDPLYEYDNSILYNDYVMQHILEKVKGFPGFQGLVYFSDHSDAVDDDEAHNPARFTFGMARIPFYMYFSSEYMVRNQGKMAVLRAATDDYFTDDLIFHTMLGVMNIRANAIDEPQNDITDHRYDKNPERFMTLYGERKIMDDQRAASSKVKN